MPPDAPPDAPSTSDASPEPSREPSHAWAPDVALSIADFQKHIRDRYFVTDQARGTPGTFMWFIEEVGELSTALQKAAGQGGATSGGENLAEEFADVLAWLCTLANINGIDLTEAVRGKYFKGGGPTGTK